MSILSIVYFFIVYYLVISAYCLVSIVGRTLSDVYCLLSIVRRILLIVYLFIVHYLVVTVHCLLSIVVFVLSSIFYCLRSSLLSIVYVCYILFVSCLLVAVGVGEGGGDC